MDSNQTKFWLAANAAKFNVSDLPQIRAKLSETDNNQFMMLQAVEFKQPSTIFLIAILLGWERFFLGDIGLGVLKVVTGYGCGVWWLIDIFSAKKRTMKYNMQQFRKATDFTGGANPNPGVISEPTPAGTADTDGVQGSGVRDRNNNAGYGPTICNPDYQPRGEGLVQKLVARVKGLLVAPHVEYETIAMENSSHAAVLANYVLPLAIIPLLFSFIGGCITLSSLFDYSFGKAIGGVFQFVFVQTFPLFGGIYVTALIINSTAGKHDGQGDFNRAFALVAYAYTPMFVAGFFNLWNGTWLICTVGVYGLYLLLSGLKPMMKPAEERANNYAVVSFLVAVAAYSVLWKVLYMIMMPSTDIVSGLPGLPNFRFP